MITEKEYLIDTREHIGLVKYWMAAAVINLRNRAGKHDASKLEEPEMHGFMAMHNDRKLQSMRYGTPEYIAQKEKHDPTVQHHYAGNDHHPEHWPNGIRDMSLLSVLEMLCDWAASTKRMKDGDLRRSIEINAERFGYGEELTQLLLNTALELEMIKPEVSE